MAGFVSRTTQLSGALVVVMILGHPLTAADIDERPPELKQPFRQLANNIQEKPDNVNAEGRVKRLQTELDAALATIHSLKETGNLPKTLQQPDSLASKDEGEDPLRSAFPISKKIGLRLAQLHFDSGSAHLSPGSLRLAKEASEWIKTASGRKVIIAGFADSVGASEMNQELSVARAQSVASALEEFGIDPANIEIKPMGEGRGPEKTGDGVAEPMNRCVAIFLAHEDDAEL